MAPAKKTTSTKQSKKSSPPPPTTTTEAVAVPSVKQQQPPQESQQQVSQQQPQQPQQASTLNSGSSSLPQVPPIQEDFFKQIFAAMMSGGNGVGVGGGSGNDSEDSAKQLLQMSLKMAQDLSQSLNGDQKDNLATFANKFINDNVEKLKSLVPMTPIDEQNNSNLNSKKEPREPREPKGIVEHPKQSKLGFFPPPPVPFPVDMGTKSSRELFYENLIPPQPEEEQQPQRYSQQDNNDTPQYIHENNSDDDSDNDSDSKFIKPRTQDLHYTLNVTLEELYKGKKKKLTLKRKKYAVDKEGNYNITEEIKKLIVQITPGMYEGQTVCFKGLADSKPNHETGDVIITLKEVEHAYFDREEVHDLSIMRNISLSEIYQCEQKFKHLDGRVIKFKTSADDVLHKREALRKITGEGMPIYNNPQNARGDLYIHFNLIMPDTLTPEQIKLLKKVNPAYEYDEDDISNVKIDESTVVIEKTLEHLTEDDWEKLQGRYEDNDETSFYDDDDESSDESSEEYYQGSHDTVEDEENNTDPKAEENEESSMPVTPSADEVQEIPDHNDDNEEE